MQLWITAWETSSPCAPAWKPWGLRQKSPGEADRLRSADRIILPGVGAFADAKAKLDATGLVPVLREEAARKPLLGICLGMQLLFGPQL